MKYSNSKSIKQENSLFFIVEPIRTDVNLSAFRHFIAVRRSSNLSVIMACSTADGMKARSWCQSNKLYH